MSVYTCINQQQLDLFLTSYSIGDLVSFCGIQAGIENTNYLIGTTKGQYILTVFESLTEKQIACYFQLLIELSQSRFPVPIPQLSYSGEMLTVLKGKPVALFNCLPGKSIENPLQRQCAELGKYLAMLHLSTKHSGFYLENTKNLLGCCATFDQIKEQLVTGDKISIQAELDFQTSLSLPVLPKGIIHADLFRDNVLFEQEHLSGIVDFYNACHDYYIFDIAIAINDWCIEGEVISVEKFNALLHAYHKVKALTVDERQYLGVFLRLAALRFWISRLEHQLNPREGELVLQKDPNIFRQLLLFHQQHQL